MKTSKEFFERVQNDEAFAKEVNEAFQAKRESGAKNVKEVVIPVAADFGYEITEEEIDAIYEQQSENMTEEELGKIAGGTYCVLLGVFALTMLSLIESILK